MPAVARPDRHVEHLNARTASHGPWPNCGSKPSRTDNRAMSGPPRSNPCRSYDSLIVASSRRASRVARHDHPLVLHHQRMSSDVCCGLNGLIRSANPSSISLGTRVSSYRRRSLTGRPSRIGEIATRRRHFVLAVPCRPSQRVRRGDPGQRRLSWRTQNRDACSDDAG